MRVGDVGIDCVESLDRLRHFVARMSWVDDSSEVFSFERVTLGDVRRVVDALTQRLESEAAARQCAVHDLYRGEPCGRPVGGVLTTSQSSLYACEPCGRAWARSTQGESRFTSHGERF